MRVRLRVVIANDLSLLVKLAGVSKGDGRLERSLCRHGIGRGYNTLQKEGDQMQPKLLVCAIAASAVFFISGLVVGQRTSSSKFDKYLRPANFVEMDYITLQVDVDNIRDQMPMRDNITTPRVYFNYKQYYPQAIVFISSDFEKAPLDTVKGLIREKYYPTFYKLKNYIPELSEDDFVLKVYRFTTDPDRKLFAECKHGNVVFY